MRRRPFKALALTTAFFLGLCALVVFSIIACGFLPLSVYVVWMATRPAPADQFEN